MLRLVLQILYNSSVIMLYIMHGSNVMEAGKKNVVHYLLLLLCRC